MLLAGSLNADIFQALKDAANKAIEAQKSLNNPVEEHSDTIVASTDQSSAQQFNSLAEEAAFKKQQEQSTKQREKLVKQTQLEEFKTIFIPQLENAIKSEISFIEKYFVKNDDPLQTIDNKYKKRAEIIQDYIALRNERKKLRNIFDEHYSNHSEYNEFIPEAMFPNIALEKRIYSVAGFVEGAFPALGYDDSSKDIVLGDEYLSRCSDGGYFFGTDSWYDTVAYRLQSIGAAIQIYKNPNDNIDRINNFQNIYQDYLKCAYQTYEKRQGEAKENAIKQKESEQQQIQEAKENIIEQKKWEQQQAKEQQEREMRDAQNAKKWEMERAQAQKQQQLKLAIEQKERQKVQGACQSWRTKANRLVYSLGVGDTILCGKSVFVIQDENTNTFTIQIYGRYMYQQKSGCIPYSSLSTAPSPYCYK
jgi:vacuolar-type H+-ATPase subunit I/STV1